MIHLSTPVSYQIVKGSIAVVTLNRPLVANALSSELLQRLNEIIQQIDQNPLIYSTILTGATDHVFCSGADLKERKNMSPEQIRTTVQLIGETVTNLEQMRMPVIAALNGVAYGGGLELALGCDLRIAANHIKIGLTETSLAIIPGAGGTQRLPRLIGIGQAKRLVFTACPILAAEALHIGLVEKVVHADQLLPEAIKIAENMASNGPIALEQAKKAINKGTQTNLATGLTIEYECYQKTIDTEDRLEGLEAFAEKRKPIYKGK